MLFSSRWINNKNTLEEIQESQESIILLSELSHIAPLWSGALTSIIFVLTITCTEGGKSQRDYNSYKEKVVSFLPWDWENNHLYGILKPPYNLERSLGNKQ